MKGVAGIMSDRKRRLEAQQFLTIILIKTVSPYHYSNSVIKIPSKSVRY